MNTVEVLTLRTLGFRTTLLRLYIPLFFLSDIVLLTTVVITKFVTVFVVMSVAPGVILFQACISLSFLVIIIVISGFRRGVNETLALPGCYKTLIVSYRRFGTTYRCHLQRSTLEDWIVKLIRNVGN